MRSYFIAGNWKMHKTVKESVALAAELKAKLAGCKEKVMVAPAFTALAEVAKVLEGSNILVGAQNMGPEEQGAHTGEVSVLMLKEGWDVTNLYTIVPLRPLGTKAQLSRVGRPPQ